MRYNQTEMEALQDPREMLYIAMHASREELDQLLRLMAHAPDQAEAMFNELRAKYVPPAFEKSRGPKTPEEVAASILEWANAPRPPAPSLSNESLRRENLYE
jgi:hypothetical protein